MSEPMPIDNGGVAAYVPEPFHGDKRERGGENCMEETKEL